MNVSPRQTDQTPAVAGSLSPVSLGDHPRCTPPLALAEPLLALSVAKTRRLRFQGWKTLLHDYAKVNGYNFKANN